ncbi:SH3 domain-containing protein [Altererythrobacter sp. KTW20L]|uniref:SH3 domain-containing protein n=1 Tax=Altererythrobacter sp. KTW20L TaxID=2942210 RepID=UPI0020BEE966|nr:SH3 domain-containing protein [Altererythrobacter sp. KTW20L]MCL6251899.1 SH3 domain-containing protein [Altererythrobacter sp. KTW20L]
MQGPLRRILIVFAALCCGVQGAAAQNSDVPYWASLSSPEVNMRVGPSERFAIAWVYQREGLPVKVIRLQQGWRLIEEPDGTRGWVFNQLLSRQRTAIVTGDGVTPIRELPEAGSALRWNVEAGVIGLLGACEERWCEFDVDGHRGWIARDRLWGAGEP